MAEKKSWFDFLRLAAQLLQIIGRFFNADETNKNKSGKARPKIKTKN